MTKEPIVCLYSPEKSFRVYDQRIWWSDRWDAREYGRPYDAFRSFFAQFRELMESVPRPALFTKGCENSDYANHAVYSKNCYMCFNGGYCENTLYSDDVILKCRSCCDATNTVECELVYDCIDTEKSYQSNHLIVCSECADCGFLYDCRNCHHCRLCWNLRNKSYCIKNVQYTREEYERMISAKEMRLETHSSYEECRRQFRSLVTAQAVHRSMETRNAVQVSGNFISTSKDIRDSFDILGSQDLARCFDAWDIRDCQDTFQTMDKAELQYETHASSVSVHALFCNVSHENADILYADHCFNSNSLFGCVGLRHQQYCILNKQYTKEAYELLVPQIIEHMRKTGEWGEFFPMECSPFAYNETVAQEYFPLTKAEVLSHGWQWQEEKNEMPQVTKMIPASELPDSIDDIPDDVLNWAIRCQESGRPFRIVKQELDFYRTMRLPAPRLHPDERHKRRLALRNPRKLWKRSCAKCGEEIQTTYAPDRPEIVYSENCYLKEVY